MFEIALWNLRRQLARINRLDDSIQKHVDSLNALDREQSEKIVRACEEGKRLFEPQRAAAPPAPAPPAPASPFAQNKAMVIAGLRGVPAPLPAATRPNPAFAANKTAVLAGLRGGR